MHMHELQGDIRASVRRVGQAAESQATLNIALTGVCVAALLVAMIVARSLAANGVKR